ncbi:MAG: hypothetical protein IT290_07385 [Deltaproteobacteria bacterium]|nr:hypothetical protein [Deltaproteobacteria bacterium]
MPHETECDRDPISSAIIKAGGSSISLYRTMGISARQECAFALIAALDVCIRTHDPRQSEVECILVKAFQVDGKSSIKSLVGRELAWRIDQLYTHRAIRVATQWLMWRKESPELDPKAIARVARRLAQERVITPHLPRSMKELALEGDRGYRLLIGAVLDRQLRRRNELVGSRPETNGHRIITAARLAELSDDDRQRLKLELLARPDEWHRMPLTPGQLAAVDHPVERRFIADLADRLVAAGELPRLR